MKLAFYLIWEVSLLRMTQVSTSELIQNKYCQWVEMVNKIHTMHFHRLSVYVCICIHIHVSTCILTSTCTYMHG